MPLLFSNPAFREDIIRALSWTLVHSLSQGMLLAVVAGGIIFFTKKARPAFRYNLLAWALLIFIIGIHTTFSSQINTKTPGLDPGSGTPASSLVNMKPAAAQFAGENLSIAARVVEIFNANSGWIVLCWLLVIVVRCVRLTTGLFAVYQLKTRQTFSPGDYWNNRIIELSRQLQINRRVRLLQSGITRIPAVIGYFKPVILFPVAMLATLPLHEVEAILMHELAHIRRNDFLVNLVQNMVEIIFFFNPAVLWVSTLLRSERENCCDEIAVNQTDNKRDYINALIAFQGFDLQRASTLANEFAGEKNHLMNRVKRIIYNKNKTLNNMEKKFLAAGMIITAVFIFAFSSNDFQQKPMIKNVTTHNSDIAASEKNLPVPVAADTVPAGNRKQKHVLNGTINSMINGQKYKIITKDDQVLELFVNGKKIPAEKMAGYKSVTDEILAQSRSDMEKVELDMEQVHEEMKEAKIAREESEIEVVNEKLEMEAAEQEMVQHKKKIELESLEIEQSNKKMEQVERDLAKIHIEQEQLEIEQSNEKLVKIERELTKKHIEQELSEREQSNKKLTKRERELAKKHMEKEMQNVKLEMENVKKEMDQSRKEMARSKKEMAESKKLQESIITDFIKEDIIKDKKDLSSYKLSNKELIVNGEKQPDDIHKRFKDKYVKTNGWTMEYNNDDSR